jgi:hypothetical protein
VSGDVDPDFLHDFDGLGVDIACGFGACAMHDEKITGGLAKDAFG